MKLFIRNKVHEYRWIIGYMLFLQTADMQLLNNKVKKCHKWEQQLTELNYLVPRKTDSSHNWIWHNLKQIITCLT